MNKSIAALFLLFCFPCFAEKTAHADPLRQILSQNNPLFREITANPEKYRVQILYTVIDRDSENFPHLTTYEYAPAGSGYFYPASLVKLPVALLALEKIHTIKSKRVTKDTPMVTRAARRPQSAVKNDRTSKSGMPSVAHYVKKMFVVSDNDAYNRLYEFLGQKYIYRRLAKMGYGDVRIVRRYNGSYSPADDRHTNPVSFVNRSGRALYSQKEQHNNMLFPPLQLERRVGLAHLDDSKNLVNEPYDFSASNYIPLRSVHEMLISVIFPQTIEGGKRFALNRDDYTLLYKCMSMLPRESRYPRYTKPELPDSYRKFLMFGGTPEPIPPNIRLFNKVALSFGFMADTAYIVDFDRGIEFFLSAVIYVNENEIVNDDIYEYDLVGYPFFRQLGGAVYQYEQSRKREYRPDLSRFRVSYDE